MRRAVLVGTMATFVALVFALLQATSVGANSAGLPALQDTATATAEADATGTAAATTATPEATVTADAAMTATAATATAVATTATPETTATATVTSFGQLPDTGDPSGPNLTLLVLGTVLLLFGAYAVFNVVGNRRKA